MLNWFRKKKKENAAQAPEIVPMKPMNYPPKIILAWAQAIEGNAAIASWLTENGYPELTIASSAIRLKDDAREWLMKNGYPHLMAMINAAEGNRKALRWLGNHRMDILSHIAGAVEDDQESWEWLKQHGTQDIFLLAKSIKKVKDGIEENHRDIHMFGVD